MRNHKLDYRKLLSLSVITVLIVQIFVFGMPSNWLGPVRGGSETWWNTSLSYRKGITIDHAKVNAALSNFPVLIDVTDSDLASKAQADGDDIAFTDENAVKLNHEIELYNSGNGHLVAWVNVPSLSSTVDTVLYMYYGNAGAANQENVTGVWDSNFMMVQHLSETSGMHYDSTANDNDGTALNGTLQGVSGKIDGADDFDGTNDCVRIPHDSTLAGYTEAMTASVWIKPDDDTSRQNILCKWVTSTDDRGWLIEINSATQVQFLASYDGTITGYGDWQYPFNPTIGNWYYWTIVWESDAIPRFYVNGVEVSTTGTDTVSQIYSSTGAPLDIGNCTYYADRSFDGIIDEVRVSNVALSAGWIATCYNNQQDPSSFYTVGTEEPITEAPIISNPSPADAATGVSVSLSQLSFNLTDPQSDPMNYTVTTSPNIGSDSGTNVGNGRYNVAVSGLAYDTTYTWNVSVTDGTNVAYKVFNFTTEEESVENPNLIIERIVTENQDCTIYANDTYANGTAHYVSVEVTVSNIGSGLADEFNVSLQVYWTTGSQEESLERKTVSSLDAEENVTLIFYWRPTHTHYYNLTAEADCDGQITEDNEGDNSLSQENVPVTIIGDINGDGNVNIFDAVVISLAWNSNPGSGHWNIHADINHDGNVDILDAVRIGLHWGENW
jgi:hypothetical protein